MSLASQSVTAFINSLFSFDWLLSFLTFWKHSAFVLHFPRCAPLKPIMCSNTVIPGIMMLGDGYQYCIHWIPRYYYINRHTAPAISRCSKWFCFYRICTRLSSPQWDVDRKYSLSSSRCTSPSLAKWTGGSNRAWSWSRWHVASYSAWVTCLAVTHFNLIPSVIRVTHGYSCDHTHRLNYRPILPTVINVSHFVYCLHTRRPVYLCYPLLSLPSIIEC